jgi:hypothetical protein
VEDPRLVRAERFRSRAAECLALADMIEIPDLVERYREMARHYEQLAQHEEDAFLPSHVPEADSNDELPPEDVTSS